MRNLIALLINLLITTLNMLFIFTSNVLLATKFFLKREISLLLGF